MPQENCLDLGEFALDAGKALIRTRSLREEVGEEGRLVVGKGCLAVDESRQRFLEADFSNGLLRISAAIAKEDQARKVQVAGA